MGRVDHLEYRMRPEPRGVQGCGPESRVVQGCHAPYVVHDGAGIQDIY
jgi:hypothetical protein